MYAPYNHFAVMQKAIEIEVYFYKWIRKEVVILLMHKTQSAQGLVEYALILLLVGLVVIFALTAFGATVGNLFSKINNSFP